MINETNEINPTSDDTKSNGMGKSAPLSELEEELVVSEVEVSGIEVSDVVVLIVVELVTVTKSFSIVIA